MKIVKSLAFSLIFICIGHVAMAQNQFVNVPTFQIMPDVASSGRGFTGVASHQSPAMLLYNPATLALQTQPGARLTRFSWLDGLNDSHYNFAAANIPIDQISSLGFYVSYLNLGSQTGRGQEGQIIQSYPNHEFSFGISYGREAIYNRLSIGVGVRFISSNHPPYLPKSNDKATGRAVAFDIGLLYYPNSYSIGNVTGVPTIGFSITNFGSRIQYSQSGYKDPLPTTMRIGISNKFKFDKRGFNILKVNVEFSKLLVRVDSSGAEAPFQALVGSWGNYHYFSKGEMQTATFFDQWMMGIGLEYWYNHMIGLRAGYYGQSDDNGGKKLFTLGMGVKYGWLVVNGSYIIHAGHSLISNGFRIGIGFDL